MDVNGKHYGGTGRMSVCLVAHNAYGSLTGQRAGFIGGVEWQTTLLARYLASRGHSVTVLTWDEGGGAEQIIDGVRVLKICRADAGLPGMRFFVPKWSGLLAALRRANADVYYHNCSECVTGQVAFWCRRHGRGFVFSVASNADCDLSLPELHSARERVLYRAGLRRATHIIAQTNTQRDRLRQDWGLHAEVIPMPCPRPVAERPGDDKAQTPRVLWVGRVTAVKRLELFLDLAERCPDVTFDLVGPFADEPYANAIKRRASGIGNVVVHGRVEKNQLGPYYRRARVLCCTSLYEGFPNTFLEAWSRGVPVVTTFDPDDVVKQHGLGAHADDVSGLQAGLMRFLASESAYTAASCRALSYYEQHHTPDQVMPRFENALARAIDATREADRSH